MDTGKRQMKISEVHNREKAYKPEREVIGWKEKEGEEDAGKSARKG